MGHRRETVMRIEAYNQVAQLYKANKPMQTSKTARPGMGSDQVQISSIGRDYQIAKQAVAETPDIREDRVAELKSKIDSGTYSVDTADFASVLLSRYNAGL